MTGRSNDDEHTEDPRLVAAWAAFVEADTRACAPPALAGRVRAAIDAEWRLGHERRSVFRQSMLRAGAGMAACFVLVAAVGLLDSGARRPAAFVGNSQRAAADADRRSPSTVVEPSPVPATLALGPVHDGEQLALVRIRVPHDSLAGLGVALTAPGEAGLVDVDVLVGDDGLPRDIRVRTVLALAEAQ